MIKLTCLLRRKEGLTPAEFHAYWRDHHGPLIANSSAAKYVVRYEQNGRPLDDYRSDDDRSGYDGVTVQWFADMDAYYAHMSDVDSPAMFADLPKFLDTDHLEFVLTEEPRVVMDGEVSWDR
jgi:EthD domain